jgi:adiponectin receptor
LHRLDYIGIVVLVVGSIEAVIYFTFYCHPWHAATYMTITLLFGLATGVVTLS